VGEQAAFLNTADCVYSNMTTVQCRI